MWCILSSSSKVKGDYFVKQGSYLARESDFGAILESPPVISRRVEGRHETPHVREILGEEPVKLPVPYQLHSETTEKRLLHDTGQYLELDLLLNCTLYNFCIWF